MVCNSHFTVPNFKAANLREVASTVWLNEVRISPQARVSISNVLGKRNINVISCFFLIINLVIIAGSRIVFGQKGMKL